MTAPVITRLLRNVTMTSKMEQPFEYMATYVPTSGSGYVRYATGNLCRSDCRRYWQTRNQLMHYYVLDDFGFLVHVKSTFKANFSWSER